MLTSSIFSFLVDQTDISRQFSDSLMIFCIRIELRMNIHHVLFFCFLSALQDGNTGLVSTGYFYAGAEGGNGSITSYFTSSGSTKFFCKGECKEEDILIKTDDVTAQSGRYSIRYEDESSGRRKVTVYITQLTKSDSGRYRCGLGESSGPDDYRDFDIIVTDEALLGLNIRFSHAGTVGGNITYPCFDNVNITRKFFCKDECNKEEHILVETEENRAQKGRYSIEYTEGSVFGLYVTITQLKKSDTGWYRCGYGRALSTNSSETFWIFVEDAPTTSKPNPTLPPFPTSVPSASTPATTQSFISSSDVECDDAQHGRGREGSRSSIRCDEGQEGNKTVVCKGGVWTIEDSCILTGIEELFNASKDLSEKDVPQLMANLSKAVQDDKTKIAKSSATISAIVDILNSVANASSTVSESIMQDVLKTVDVIIADDARESWEVLNGNETQNATSRLLGSLETLSEVLTEEFNFTTQGIQLNRTTFNKSFSANLNSSVVIDIPNNNNDNVFITIITFSTLNNVMPAQTSSSDTSINNAINAAVVLVKTNASIQDVTLRFNKRNKSLEQDSQCVFWNFTLRDNLGDWDDKGCKFVSDINNTVTCSCNHLTSFSINQYADLRLAHLLIKL